MRIHQQWPSNEMVFADILVITHLFLLGLMSRMMMSLNGRYILPEWMQTSCTGTWFLFLCCSVEFRFLLSYCRTLFELLCSKLMVILRYFDPVNNDLITKISDSRDDITDTSAKTKSLLTCIDVSSPPPAESQFR